MEVIDAFPARYEGRTAARAAQAGPFLADARGTATRRWPPTGSRCCTRSAPTSRKPGARWPTRPRAARAPLFTAGRARQRDARLARWRERGAHDVDAPARVNPRIVPRNQRVEGGAGQCHRRRAPSSNCWQCWQFLRRRAELVPYAEPAPVEITAVTRPSRHFDARDPVWAERHRCTVMALRQGRRERGVSLILPLAALTRPANSRSRPDAPRHLIGRVADRLGADLVHALL